MRGLLLVSLLLLPALSTAQDDEPISIVPAGDGDGMDGSSPSNQPKMGLVGIVTLWPKGSLPRNGLDRPSRERCPKFGDWKNVTCWWPSVSYSDLPEECTYMHLPKRVPEVIQQLIKSKAEELYDAVAFEYNQRGKPAKCGYCSRSFKCRARNMTDDSDDDSESRGRRPRPGQTCRAKEIQQVHDECDDHAPCKVTKDHGLCSAPFFLNPLKIDRVNQMIQNNDHRGAANELFSQMNGRASRSKRQSGFGGYPGSDGSGDDYGMTNRQFDDSGYGNGDSGNDGGNQRYQYDPSRGRGGNGGRGRQGPGGQGFGPGDGQGFGPQGGQAFGPGGRGDGQGFGPQGGQGFGPGGRGDGQGFGPQGGQGFGSDNSQFDDSMNRFGPGGGGRRPGGRGFGPGGYDDDRRRPFGPRGRGFGPGGDDDDRRRPFGPGGRGFGPGGDDGSQFGPNRRGRGGDDDRRRPWGGRGFGSSNGARNQTQQPDFMGMPAMSLWSNDIRRDAGDMGRDHHEARGFIQKLLHGTTCVTSGDSCLCCCGPYVPNANKTICEDIRQLIPGIDNLADVDSENTPPQPPMGNNNGDSQKRRQSPPGGSFFEKMQKPQIDF